MFLIFAVSPTSTKLLPVIKDLQTSGAEKLSLAASSWDLRARVEDSMGLYGVLYGLYGVLPKCDNIYELLRDIFLQWAGAYPHFSMRKLTPKEIKSFAQYHRAIWWQCHITWRRQWQPTPVLLPGKSHGRRSLLGYIPWVHKESDTTEETQPARTHSWLPLLWYF